MLPSEYANIHMGIPSYRAFFRATRDIGFGDPLLDVTEGTLFWTTARDGSFMFRVGDGMNYSVTLSADDSDCLPLNALEFLNYQQD